MNSDVLLKTLSYLDNQEYPLLLEVLIIDDGSTRMIVKKLLSNG